MSSDLRGSPGELRSLGLFLAVAALGLALAACPSPESILDGGDDADVQADGDGDADGDTDVDGDADADADGEVEADVDADFDVAPLPDGDPERPAEPDPEIELSYWLVHSAGYPGGPEGCSTDTISATSPGPGQVILVCSCITTGVVGSCGGHAPQAELVDRTLHVLFVGGTGSACYTSGYDFTVVFAGLPAGSYEIAVGDLSTVVEVI